MNLFSHVSKRPIFQQLSWYTAAQIIVQGVAFVSAIIVTRYLGPINLGLYSFVQNFVGTLLTVGGGMDFYFMWKIARSDNHIHEVRKFVGYKFSIYILLSLFGLLSAWVVLPHDVAFMVTLMLIPACLNSLSVFSLYLTATDKARLMSLVQITVSISLLLIKIILVKLAFPLYAFVIVAAIDSALGGILITITLLRTESWKDFFVAFRLPSFVKAVTFLYSIRTSILAITLWQLLLRIDQLILATFSNAYTLGIYSAAVKVAEVPNFLAGALSAALVSRMSYISTNKDEVSKKRLRTIMSTYFAAGTLIAAMIIILAPFAIHILYGAKFAGSVSVLRVYALSIPGMFMNYFFLGMYGAQDRQHHQVFIFGCAVALNTVLIYVLTPLYGLTGTALATAVAYLFAAAGFYTNLKK